MLAFINTFGILVSEVEHFVEGIYDLMPVKLRRVMFQGLWWSLTGQLSWTLVKRRIFGKGASPFTTLIDLKKELSSFG
ncbi:uncharacterized protein DS421_14g462130 [Arachis hypogaea]|nr:uncharacterized protein DS421_14g462130 [Arachis hypogaea]